MPEGIEIASIATDLNKMLRGKTALNFRMDQHYLKRAGKEYKDFLDLLPLKIESVTFKGKVIVFDLGGACFTSQLGMSGRWGFKKNIPHTHIQIQFGNNGKGFWIYYADARRFGTVRFYCGEEGRNALAGRLNKLAPDFLSERPITEDEFVKRFSGCHCSQFVGALLMDQEKICSGVGNYILSELFYRCKLHPFVRVYDVASEEISRVYEELKAIMSEGFAHRGNSIQDYYNIDGEKGRYQDHLRVYMKKRDPLGNHVLRQNGPHKRTIHWVPSVQKKKLRLRIDAAPESANVPEGLCVGLGILLSPYKNCVIQVFNNPGIAGEYNFETTEDDRCHLLLCLGPGSPNSFSRQFLEREVHFA